MSEAAELSPWAELEPKDAETSTDHTICDFPVMAEEAFTGLAGEIVQMIEPHNRERPIRLAAQHSCFFRQLCWPRSPLPCREHRARPKSVCP